MIPILEAQGPIELIITRVKMIMVTEVNGVPYADNEQVNKKELLAVESTKTG